MTETLTSAQNPKVRKLLALQQKSAERRESGLFVLEGVRELLHCLSAGYEAAGSGTAFPETGCSR